MTEQDKKQLDLEVDHIFDSGASPTRISEMVERFIDSRNLIKNHSDLSNVIETKGQLAILMIETEKKIADIQEGGLGDHDDDLIDALIGKYEKYEEEYSSL